MSESSAPPHKSGDWRKGLNPTIFDTGYWFLNLEVI